MGNMSVRRSVRSGLLGTGPFVLGALALLAVLGVGGGDLGAQPAVPFYGAELCGDEFVFCIDRSAYMGADGVFAPMIAEVQGAIGGMVPGQRFAIVAFGSTISTYSPTLVDATPAEIAAATQWLAALAPVGNTVCVGNGVVAAIDILDAAGTLGDHAVILAGNRDDNCIGPANAINAVIAANTQGHAIHPRYLGSDAGGWELYNFIAQNALGDGVLCPPDIRRGDANGDGSIDLSDAIRILGHLFTGMTGPFCEDAADVNDTGGLHIGSAISLLNRLFWDGPGDGPGLEFGPCWRDPTFDSLGCTDPGPCP